MATYKSNPVDLAASCQTMYDKLTDLGRLGEFIKNIPADQVPDDKRQMLDSIRVTDSTITIPGGPTGDLTLAKGDCEAPSKVVYVGENTPVPVTLECDLAATGEDSCQAEVIADIKVPAMLKPMLNGPMNKMLEQVAMMLTQLARH